jgi:hypothetical protein
VGIMSIQQIRTKWDKDIKYDATSCEDAILTKLEIVVEPASDDHFTVTVECENCRECESCTFYPYSLPELLDMFEWIFKKPTKYPTYRLPHSK